MAISTPARPEVAGEFDIACAQHCGPNHYKMKGRLIVMPPKEFEAWYRDAVADARRGYDPDTEALNKQEEQAARINEQVSVNQSSNAGMLETVGRMFGMRSQMQGQGGYSFQLWTIMNAVLWHASWVESRRDIL